MDRQWLKEGSAAIDQLLAAKFPTTNMASFVSHALKLRGPVRIFTTACSAGNYAIGFGYDLLQTNEVDYALAGGADGAAGCVHGGSWNGVHGVGAR